MVFDVVFLCRDGRDRLRSDVLSDMPIRGDVSILRGGIAGDMATLVRLIDAPGKPCRTLRSARAVPMRGRHLMIEGIEQVRDDRGGTMNHRQVWWCRLPRDGESAGPFDPDPPSAVQRDPSYV